MSGYKHPQPITGTAPDVALNPLLAARKIPSLMRLLKKVKLKNPIYHHTSADRSRRILSDEAIKGTWQSDDFNKHIGKVAGTAFSITRDPKFLSRPHFNVGTDVRFIMDRDDLIKKGYKIKPYALKGFRKTEDEYGNVKELEGLYNPRFEFEERILGNLPIKDIKLIDITNIPSGAGSRFKSTELIKELIKSNVPIIRSPQTTEQIINIEKMLNKHGYHPGVKSSSKQYRKYIHDNLYKLLKAPTYKYNPFKLRKGVDEYNNPPAHQKYLKKELGDMYEK